MVLGPGRGMTGLGGCRGRCRGAATEAAEAGAPGWGAGIARRDRARRARQRAPATASQASSHRPEQSAPRSASSGLTLGSAHRRPAPFSRASTTTLLALSTMPLPIGKPWARKVA